MFVPPANMISDSEYWIWVLLVNVNGTVFSCILAIFLENFEEIWFLQENRGKWIRRKVSDLGFKQENSDRREVGFVENCSLTEKKEEVEE